MRERIGPNSSQRRAFGVDHRVWSLLLGGILLGAFPAPAQDAVPIPAGPASVRRLLGLDPDRPKEAFFLDLHETLLSDANPHGSWDRIEKRKALVSFAEELGLWRTEFGNPAVFSTSNQEEWKRVQRALEWLGFAVEGEPRSFSAERRADLLSLRRRDFLDTLGASEQAMLARLRAGEKVTIAAADETAPLPFGIAAWREILNEPSLEAPSAFLYFLKNVRASRMLVALHALDPETREGLSTLLRDEKGQPLAWRILYGEAFDSFTRFPEALSLRDGTFALPGGKDAEAIWTDIVGVSPSNRAKFLSSLYRADSGKAAYVIDALQQLPDRNARELLLGRAGRGKGAVKRFRRLYRAIERDGENYELFRRAPYDFGHLAWFLKLSDEGDLALPAWDLDELDFPQSDAEVGQILSRARKRAEAPEEALRRLFRLETRDPAGRFPGQRRFLFVSSLLEARPNLEDPGLTVLLLRGLDRFFPAYAAFEDIPMDPPLARRYLYTLDRLDRLGDSREARIRAGLFQADVELLAQLSRAGALNVKESREIFSALLDLALFSRAETTLAQGEEELFRWLSGRLLATLRGAERRVIEAAILERTRREEAYREALQSRDARIRERRRSERAQAEADRLAAEEKLRSLLGPVCPQDDAILSPPRARFLEEEGRLAEALATLAPLPPEPELEVALGALPGTSAIVDQGEPLPAFVPVDIPEESESPDDLLTRALVGPPATAYFEWRGGRYRFDPSTDESRRREEFRQKQLLTWLGDLETLHNKRDSLLTASGKGDLAAAKSAVSELVTELNLESAKDASREGGDLERGSKEQERARDEASHLMRLSKPTQLTRARVTIFDAVLAERHLEALLGHLYASSAGDPDNLYYEDPGFVRRHAFRGDPTLPNGQESAFSKTVLTAKGSGGGSRVTGSVFGLSDVLGLLHTDQARRAPGNSHETEDVRAALVGSIRRMSVARLDDDAMHFVVASCRATEELAAALASVTARERSRIWSDLGRDLVTRSRLGLVSALEGAPSPEALSRYLSPSDLYRIGRRLALKEAPSPLPTLASAAEAEAALQRLQRRFGEVGARERLAQFGPRPVNYAGRFRLTDMDLPPYERLTAYRGTQMFSDRLYDLKIAVARRIWEAGLPAATLPLVLPAALDEMISRLRMGFSYDWASVVRSAQSFSKADLNRHLDDALKAGRLARDQSGDELLASE